MAFPIPHLHSKPVGNHGPFIFSLSNFPSCFQLVRERHTPNSSGCNFPTSRKISCYYFIATLLYLFPILLCLAFLSLHALSLSKNPSFSLHSSHTHTHRDNSRVLIWRETQRRKFQLLLVFRLCLLKNPSFVTFQLTLTLKYSMPSSNFCSKP